MNEMKDKVLMELGLSQNESKIYLALLEHGAANPTIIAEESGIHRVNVYDSLAKLKERGLVSEIIYAGKRQFQAAPPEALKNIIKEKEIRLSKILPELQMAGRLALNSQTVQMYEGYDFIRNLFLHFLEINEDILALDVPKYVVENMGTFFQDVIHTRRAAQKQNMYHIYNKDALDRIRFLNSLPFTQARYLDKEVSLNEMTLICGDEVSIHIFSLDPSKKPIVIVIKDKMVADTFRRNFFLLWDQATKP